MIVRVLFSVAFLLLAAVASLSAQVEFRPLSAYSGLAKAPAGAAFDKVDCGEFNLDGFLLVRPGEEVEEVITPDTSGLGGNITYSCNGCNVAMGGTSLLRADTLIYEANAGIEELVEELIIQACNTSGDCGEPLTVRILVQREGADRTLPAQSVAPGGTITVAGPTDDFADKAFCRSIETCAPDYLGREQRVFFPRGQADSNEFTYEAARYGGRDQVCLTLCSEFGLCDVYKTEIIIDRPAFGLPFLDDFSEDGFRPGEALWQDEDVLINRNFAQTPLSIGVATFDAVDFKGDPYPDAGGGRRTVPRDFLTSNPLLLSGQVGSTLSFFVQARGFGNRPEIQDSFLVQFLDREGNWDTVLGIPGKSNTLGNDTIFPFEPYIVPLADEYLYDGFTFRFAGKSSESGAVDMWHLDYVKLDREINTLEIDDLAMVNPPGPILGPYSSIPLRHFQASGEDLLQPDIEVGLYNFAGRRLETNVNAKAANIVVATEGQTLADSELIDPNVSNLPGQFPAQDYTFRTVVPNWIGFANVQDYLNGLTEDGEPIVLTTTLRADIVPEANSFSPSIGRNNRVSTETVLDEYMAYDDGSAEATVEATERTYIVQQFTAFVEDNLRGLQIRIPRSLGAFGNQELRLVVFSGDEMPEALIYQEDFPVLSPEDVFRDTLEGFTTYLFDDDLELPAGNFFVGWQQARANRPIGVGYDRNTDTQSFQWFDFGNGWQRLLGPTTGTLMIRPLLSGFDGFTTNTDEVDTGVDLVDIFPNPTSGTLHLRPRQITGSEQFQVRLFATSGALLRQQLGLNPLDISNLPAGIYVLEITDGQRRSHHKVIRN